MARPRKYDGHVFRRKGTQFWWIRYRDRTGTRRAEPTGTADWKEAQKKLRERLQARDENVLEIVRKGEELTFQQWAELFLENHSKPPLRTPKTHEANRRAITHLLPAFGGHKLADMSGDAIEGYSRYRLRTVDWVLGQFWYSFRREGEDRGRGTCRNCGRIKDLQKSGRSAAW